MYWVIVISSTLASACLTLAAIHLIVWSKNRRELASLAFAFAALGIAGTAAGELWMMRSRTIVEFGMAMRWAYLPVTVLVLALVGFVEASYRNGRPWLMWLAVGLQVLALILGFTTGECIVYRSIDALQNISFLGESVSVVASGVRNPWIIVDQLASLAMMAFVVDGSVRLWRRGAEKDRRKALRLGGSIITFMLLAAGYSAFVDAQVIKSPYLISIPFLGILLVTGFDLSEDVLRAHQLVRELRTNETNLLGLRTEQENQLRFERMVTDISATLMHAPAADVDKLIVKSMGQVAEMLGFEISVYSLLFGDGTGIIPYVWNKPGVAGMPPNLTDRDFPWKARELSAGRDTHITTIDDFPPEAEVDRATYERYGIKSSFDVSIIVGGRAVGVFSFGSYSREQSMPPELIQRQRIVGDLFANAIFRARSETALRESEDRLRLAADAASLGLWRWNLQDNSMWATERAKRIFGFPPDKDVTFVMWRDRVHPEDLAAVEAALAAAVARKGSYETEYRAVGENGEERWIAASGQAAAGFDGEPSSMTGVVMDITGRKKAEQEMQELRRELAHSGRVTLLGQLASALAHELGQPLGAILRNAEAADLILQEEPADLEELRAIVTDIRRDDRRAGDVIARLRSLLKRREMEFQPVGIEGLIAEVVALVKSDATERRVKIDVVTPGTIGEVNGDRIHLQQVLLNLIINAMDALQESRSAERRIVIHASGSADDRIALSVGDNGPGIEEDKLGKLFDPFFTTKSSGMGVGLAVSKHLIEAHHGRIWAENLPEGGAVFRFTLPVIQGGIAT